jgi:hypothetical protein
MRWRAVTVLRAKAPQPAGAGDLSKTLASPGRDLVTAS